MLSSSMTSTHDDSTTDGKGLISTLLRSTSWMIIFDHLHVRYEAGAKRRFTALKEWIANPVKSAKLAVDT